MKGLAVFLLLVVALGVGLVQFGVVDMPFMRGAEPRVVTRPADEFLTQVRADPSVATTADLTVVNGRTTTGATPLMILVQEGNRDAVWSLLLRDGVMLDAVDEQGRTALHLAAAGDDPQLVLWLLNAGANPNLKDAAGQDALTVARTTSPQVAASGMAQRMLELADANVAPGVPIGYVAPVQGATISGRRHHLPGAPREYRNGVHEGFDFYAGNVSVDIEYGTPIQAVADGVVIRADHDYTEMTLDEYEQVIQESKAMLITPEGHLDKLRGRQVWIRHPGGFVSRYAHLSGIAAEVQVGSIVQQGKTVAFTGNSGSLEAAQQTQDDAHPHVELWQGEERYVGQGAEPAGLYQAAAQAFGDAALPPYTDTVELD